VLQVANMKGRQRKLDVAKVAVALVETLSTGAAFPCLARDTHVDVHGPVGGKGARVVGGGGEVVDIAVRDFEDGLVYNVLVGAASCYYASCRACAGGEAY